MSFVFNKAKVQRWQKMPAAGSLKMLMEKNNLKYLRKNLGENLWSLRQQHNYTLAYVSKQTGVSPKCLEKIKLSRGVPLDLLLKLFNYYKKKINIELVD